MKFRVFLCGQAAAIMDYCDNNSIDYEIWNAEDMFDQDVISIEIGLSDDNWAKLPSYLFSL